MSTNKINKGSHFCSGSGFWFLFGLLQTKTGGNKIDYTNKQAQLQGYFSKQYADLDIELEKVDGTPSGNSGQIPPNGNANGQGNGNGNNTGGNGNGNGNNVEAFVFYYHPDHLGSSSYISDANGEVCQHLEYFAFGETFLEEHSNTERTPYLFNGKELDEETGLYYYGARYYDPKTSVWQSVDPLAEEFPEYSPYCYTLNNPIRLVDPDGKAPSDIVILGANKSSVTIKTDLIDVKVNASSLGVDFGGNYSLSGGDIVQAAVDIAGVFDPTPASDIIGAKLSADSGDWWGAGASVLGAALPYAGDLAKGPKIAKGLDKISDAINSADNAKALLKQGRAGKQERLIELATDSKLGKSDKGWIKQEMNQIERGKRTNVRNPPGKDLAHERGREAAKGYSYKHSNLQNRADHRTQHKYDNNGRKNKERKLD